MARTDDGCLRFIVIAPRETGGRETASRSFAGWEDSFIKGGKKSA